jgi:hypothetical protein
MTGMSVYRRPAALLPCRAALGLVCAAILAARPATAQETTPPKASSVTEGADAQRAVRVLQGGLQQSRDNLQNLGSRLPKVQRELDQLINDAQSVQVRQKGQEPKPPKDAPVEKIRYRKPHEQLTEKSALNFVCENSRISFVDFKEINQKCRPFLEGSNRTFRFDLSDSDFRIEGTRDSNGVKLTVVRKADHPGESLEEIQRPGSRFQKVLSARKPADCYIDFSVWPDSHAVFREVRSRAWDRGFDVGWNPMSAGAKMMLVSGTGGGGMIQ